MEQSGRNRWLFAGCYSNRRAPCTMNLQEFMVAISRDHRLVDDPCGNG
jgi:hypothetical protein